MVSVVINTRNEGKNIDLCLKSIRDQSYRDLEIIVVDNSSTDGTKDLAKHWGAFVYDYGPERSEQKNFGAQKANGGYLLFIDADMELMPGVISSCREKIQEGFGALVIPEVSVGNGFWAECRSLEKKMYFNDPLIEAPRFFRKEIFELVGGYSPGMVSGEDWDLREKIKKQGAKIGRVNDLIYHHEGALSLVSSAKKKFYYATYSGNYLSKNPQGPWNLIVFVLRPSYIKNIKYLLLDPLHFLGMMFLKGAEFASGLLGVIYSKYESRNTP